LYKPYYNILTEASSSLGRKHSLKTRLKMSKAHSGENNSQWGKKVLEETRKFQSQAQGQLIYFYTLKGDLEYEFTSFTQAVKHFKSSLPTLLRYLENRELYKGQWLLSLSPSGSFFSNSQLITNKFGVKKLSTKTKLAMSIAKGSTIYLYSSNRFTLIDTFTSLRHAAKSLNISRVTIKKYTELECAYRDKWFFSIKKL